MRTLSYVESIVYNLNHGRFRFEYPPSDLTRWILRQPWQNFDDLVAYLDGLSRSRRARICRLLEIPPDMRDRDGLGWYFNLTQPAKVSQSAWEACYQLRVFRYNPTPSGKRLKV